MNPDFLTLEMVSRWFGQGHAEVRALTEISCSLPKGAQAVLTGPSGSGKTTLLNLIGALDRPTSGSVHVAGREVSGLDERSAADFRRTQVGFVFQDDTLLPELTLAENVELPLVLQRLEGSERRRRVDELLQELGLSKRRNAYPAVLSGGEKQRAVVARAVIHRPVLLLADEPTANLDTEAAQVVVSIMREFAAREDVTLLIATHDARVYEEFGQILCLQDGELLTQC